MDFKKMMSFVKDKLEKNDAIVDKRFTFRNRYDHSIRVFKWVKRLSVDFDNFDYDVALTAAIFHDVGYAYGQSMHPENSSKIFLEYANNEGFNQNFIDKVNYIILNHSNKGMLKDTKNAELIILLEADLLDEEGSMVIVWDLLAAGKDADSYVSAIKQIKSHSIHILSQDFMVTPTAIKIWDEKKNLVKDFISQLYEDLFLEEEI